MTALGARVSRKRMLMLVMGLFTAGNLLSELAPTYSVMLLGRVVASLAHGARFGIGSVVATELVARDRKAGALVMMFSGLTVGNVVGVPLGTLIGQSGWRVTSQGSRRWVSSGCRASPGWSPTQAGPRTFASATSRPPSRTSRSCRPWR